MKEYKNNSFKHGVFDSKGNIYYYIKKGEKNITKISFDGSIILYSIPKKNKWISVNFCFVCNTFYKSSLKICPGCKKFFKEYTKNRIKKSGE